MWSPGVSGDASEIREEERDAGIAVPERKLILVVQGILGRAREISAITARTRSKGKSRINIAAKGQFFAAASDAKISIIDVRDIAEVAAAALVEPGHEASAVTSGVRDATARSPRTFGEFDRDYVSAFA